ncbi:MAG: hypothetical protein EOO03_07030 [Chitinophagaceae bacterium]|nr:MAG: hypothetical protein EOO03_07030 [Chitinophagaceae bacterium]
MSNSQSNKPIPPVGTGPGKSGKENADMDRDTTADAEMDGDLAKGEVNPGEPAPPATDTVDEKESNQEK